MLDLLPPAISYFSDKESALKKQAESQKQVAGSIYNNYGKGSTEMRKFILALFCIFLVVFAIVNSIVDTEGAALIITAIAAGISLQIWGSILMAMAVFRWADKKDKKDQEDRRSRLDTEILKIDDLIKRRKRGK